MVKKAEDCGFFDQKTGECDFLVGNTEYTINGKPRIILPIARLDDGGCGLDGDSPILKQKRRICGNTANRTWSARNSIVPHLNP